MKDRDELMWILVAGGSAVAASVLIRKALERGWTAYRGEDPPENPAAWDVDWKDALVWTGAISIAAGLGRVVAKRGAASGWKALTGRQPPI